MSHTEGKLFVMDLREFGKEELSISNGQEKRGIVCRIKNEVRKDPLDDEDLTNARRLVACWNALEGVPTEWLENYVAGGAKNLMQENATLKAEVERLEGANALNKNALRLAREENERLREYAGDREFFNDAYKSSIDATKETK